MSQFITPEVSIPQRNITQEQAQVFGAQSRYAGPYYDLEAKYGPLYNRLAIRSAGESTLGFDDNGTHVPGSLELGRTASQTQREQDLSDVERLGPRSVEADLNANPWLRRSLSLLSGREQDSPLLQKLNEQAMSGLASGGALSADETRNLDQQTLAEYADRGILNGDQSLGATLLNRDAAKRGRMAAAQQFAMGVQPLNQQQNDFIGRATQIDATALNDPYMAILARSGGAGGGGAGMTPIGQYTRAFDPYNPYFTDLFSSNQSAAATEAIGNAQAQAATRAAIASIAGSAIKSDIRAKENIREIGEALMSNGKTVPRYTFTYRAGCVPRGLRGDRAYEGVLADEVAELFPGAVSVDRETGFKQVDYAMIGIEFRPACIAERSTAGREAV